MSPGRDIAEKFLLDEEPSVEPRYNIAPTQMAGAVRIDPETGTRRFVVLKWGLVPFWAKEKSIGSRLINARAESVAEKPAFRAAFKYRRCLVPANGFYEWKKLKARKQPYLISAGDEGLIAFAGLWEHWESPEGEIIESFTILTTDANEAVSDIHDRMPVILPEEDHDVWLDHTITKPDRLVPLLRPYPAADTRIRPVSSQVNKAAAEGPGLIEKVPNGAGEER